MRAACIAGVGIFAGCVYENPAWLGESIGGAASTGAASTDSDPTGDASTGESGGPAPGCEPLPDAPSDAIVLEASNGANLDAIIASAAPGSTVLLGAGSYLRDGLAPLRIDVPGLTLRGESGDASDVMIVGGPDTNVLVEVRAADVTIADITLSTAQQNLVAFTPDFGSFAGPRILRSTLVDGGSAHVYIQRTAAPAFVDDGEIACSEFRVSDAFRETRSACNLEGVRGNGARGWLVRDSAFQGFFCLEGGEGTTAVHFTEGSRDTVVERNTVLDAFRGIGIGGDFGAEGDVDARVYDDDPCAPGLYEGHIGGVVRNNMLQLVDPRVVPVGDTTADAMIFLWWACDAAVYHNTVVTLVPAASGIEYRYARTSVRLANNLMTVGVDDRDGAVALLLDTNVIDAPLTDFVDALGGDLHITASASDAIDRALPITDDPVLDDFDRDARGELPDIGADERP